ncbi:hypothetical protein DRH27_03920 [Candidatus Falkowbacteria bacterium]|nr:MAG: hypothetical protein DRH27_03920 [Candidatus Falkowbacteria bacterium]
MAKIKLKHLFMLKSTANILGVKISLDNKRVVLEKIINFLNSDKQHFITTPNPEIILYASNNNEYKKILNKADIAIADGFGVKLAGLTLKKNIPRITGADLIKDILKITENKKYKICILNRKKGLSSVEDIEISLNSAYPQLSFKVFSSKIDVSSETLKKINSYNPDILFVAFGAPNQEKFIFNNLNNIKSVKLAVGIGGAFDFLTGRIKRAPEIFRIIGMEWLWRIFQAKGKRKLWRSKRIYNAVIVFSFKFIKWRLFKKYEKTI